MKIITPSDFLERSAVGFLIFSAASVTVLARSTMTWEYLIMPLILAVTGILLTLIYNTMPSYRFILFICAYFILAAVQGMIFGGFHAKYLALYPLNFWVAYCFVRAMRERLLLHLEILISYLSGISLAIWSIEITTSGMISRLLNGIFVGMPYNSIIKSYIFFQTFIDEGVESYVPRNSGFAWEPGAFSVLCSLGLMINLYRFGFRLRGNYRGIILVAALLSSQSTTGYSILAIYMILKLWHDMSSAGRIFVFPGLAAAILIAFTTLPFMQNKVEELWSQDLKELTISASSKWNADQPVAAQRFLSFKMDFSDFLNHPWTGYGGEEEQMLVRREALNVVSVSGIGKILARFGFLGFIFFVWSTIASSMTFSRHFRSRSPALLALFILAVSVSYSLIEHPLFISVWCFAFFGGFARDTYRNVEGQVTE